MGVWTEDAIVFRGGGRRWFTRKAAERAEARAAIKRRCECCGGDAVTPAFVCAYHVNPVRFNRMVSLYAAMFVRRPSPAPLPTEK